MVLVHLNLGPALQTDQRGDPSPHEQQLPLKRTGVRVWLLQEADVTGLRPLQPKQQTVVVTPVGACVLPALDCRVTCALITEGVDCVIVGQRWTINSSSSGSSSSSSSGCSGGIVFEKVVVFAIFFFFFFCVPQLYLWGSPLLGEIFAYVTFFFFFF